MIDKEASVPKGNGVGHLNGQSNGGMDMDEEL
jgi:hypothetical protein